MKKSFLIVSIVIVMLIWDRFLFMPRRLDNLWEYETGKYIGDPIAIDQDIDVINNFEINISKNGETASFYLIGCYFGNLLLLERKQKVYKIYYSVRSKTLWNYIKKNKI